MDEIAMSETEIKNIVCQTGKQLLKEGLVVRTWGNVSHRLDEEYMVITPSGKVYDQLEADDMVVVHLKTFEAAGKHKPSSEFKMHAGIYLGRKNINAIIHTHQVNASVVAACRREVPPIFDDQVQLIGPSVRVTDYAMSNTRKIVRKVIKALAGRNAALIANHGAVCIGRDMDEAYTVALLLEKTCKAFIEGEFLGQVKTIHKFQAWVMHNLYLSKYSKEAKK
ncbi:MAG: class II aldolase/adducin family protein [Bacteroidetes bacterium]|nr:class II aldolase/adducin family protein [Bacteroidota bacterium]